MKPDHIGRYRVVRLLGQGGMGVVYEGYDERLDRAVAIKVVRPDVLADAAARERFRREARAAARVNHPHICPLYEFDEEAAQPYLVMELLSGVSLAKRLEAGALPPGDVARLAEQMLSALAALHQHGVVHRDLKPANIFLTPHGVKLVDFGLAQPTAFDDVTHVMVTGAGELVGTPQYMAPERLFGKPTDERADLWAAAAVLYEASAGRPAFPGRTLAEVVHAVGYEEPVALTGPFAEALDRAIRPAFVKDTARRLATADELAERIRSAVAVPVGDSGSLAASGRRGAVFPAAALTRFVALPLRILRPDPETDFLAFSIPDAVSAALADLESLTVRAPRPLPAGPADATTIGKEWGVDVVLTGTLLRAGSAVRVSAQLIDATDGTLRWSDTAQAPLTDLFGLQDSLTRHIVSSLQLPLSGRDRRALARQAPASPEAYELFMRANQLITESARWTEARELYERATALDPTYAPAWAGLGRARRLLAKWSGKAGAGLLPQAQAALARALALDPDLSAAHELAAYVDVELGLAPEAMARLLDRAAVRPNDAGLMAGLVIACRYAGLYDASVAAYMRAAAIDPQVRTSVAWTYFHRGEYARAIHADTGTPPFCTFVSQVLMGELTPAAVRTLEESMPIPSLRVGLRVYRQLSEGLVDPALKDLDTMGASGFADPEGWFLAAMFLRRANADDHALAFLTRAIDAGFACLRPLVEGELWRPMHDRPDFRHLVDRARTLVERARLLYARADGPALLGPGV